MTNLDHFRASFERAVARSKVKKVTQHVQREVQTERIAVSKITATKATTTKLLSDEQYKVSIITLAIAHIKKKWSNAQ